MKIKQLNRKKWLPRILLPTDVVRKLSTTSLGLNLVRTSPRELSPIEKPEIAVDLQKDIFFSNTWFYSMTSDMFSIKRGTKVSKQELKVIWNHFEKSCNNEPTSSKEYLLAFVKARGKKITVPREVLFQ